MHDISENKTLKNILRKSEFI